QFARTPPQWPSEHPSRHSAHTAVPWLLPFVALAGSPRNAKSTKRAHRSRPGSQCEVLEGLWVKLLRGLGAPFPGRPLCQRRPDCTPFHHHVGPYGLHVDNCYLRTEAQFDRVVPTQKPPQQALSSGSGGTG